MGLQQGMKLSDIPVDMVFIGSCTNARIEDMRAAAAVVRGHKKADNVERVLVVPGSGLVKRKPKPRGLIRYSRGWHGVACAGMFNVLR